MTLFSLAVLAGCGDDTTGAGGAGGAAAGGAAEGGAAAATDSIVEQPGTKVETKVAPVMQKERVSAPIKH